MAIMTSIISTTISKCMASFSCCLNLLWYSFCVLFLFFFFLLKTVYLSFHFSVIQALRHSWLNWKLLSFSLLKTKWFIEVLFVSMFIVISIQFSDAFNEYRHMYCVALHFSICIVYAIYSCHSILFNNCVCALSKMSQIDGNENRLEISFLF